MAAGETATFDKLVWHNLTLFGSEFFDGVVTPAPPASHH
jgi:hypothetical protein